LDKNDINAEESEANRLSRDWLLNSEAFAALKATKPYFSRKCIEQFAQSRHPGIVLGRLQRENEVGYKHLRTLLVKVSPWLPDISAKEWEVNAGRTWNRYVRTKLVIKLFLAR